jgi:DNA-binding MarR family transcriptional regulator
MPRLNETYMYKLDRLKLLVQIEIDTILSQRIRGLSMSQFFLIFAVKDLINPNQSQIAAYLNVSGAAISRQVTVAEVNGLIEVSKNRELNQNILSLTKKGLNTFCQAYQIVNIHLLDIFQNSEDLDGLSGHLDKLLIKSKEGISNGYQNINA